MARICCSPPDSVPAGWRLRSASRGKRCQVALERLDGDRGVEGIVALGVGRREKDPGAIPLVQPAQAVAREVDEDGVAGSDSISKAGEGRENPGRCLGPLFDHDHFVEATSCWVTKQGGKVGGVLRRELQGSKTGIGVAVVPNQERKPAALGGRTPRLRGVVEGAGAEATLSMGAA